MGAISNSVPLIALDASVVDTETTGADPAKARIVEIAALRLVAGRIETTKPFRSLVQPTVPIAAAATAIHGIDAAKVADAPHFGNLWPEFSRYLQGIVIGHSVGFDLAVIKRECEAAGLSWNRPRALDTRLLAEIVAPELAEYTIEGLCSWLDVEITERHTAYGDALTTARIFRALLPKLRERDIRTLGEAVAACGALTDAIDRQHWAGWEPLDPPSRTAAEATLRRIDSYPYRHRIRDVMSAPAQSVAAGTPLRNALSRMRAAEISSLFVTQLEGDSKFLASDAGIITERDILRALDSHGAQGLVEPVEKFMSKPLAVVPAEAFVYRAIGRMSRLNIRHLGVVDEADQIVGALSARALLRLRADEAISLGDAIDQAADVHDLGLAWAKLPQVASALMTENVPVRDVAGVISSEVAALTRRAAVIAESRMHADGHGLPPCPYAFAVLGSAGRGESLLAMDQDNALIFAEGVPGGSEDRWFEALSVHVADILHEVGVPYCKGGVMAKNPQWRGSVATWQARIGGWISRSQPEDLLAVDIFFDLLGVHGDGGLADRVWREAFSLARGQVGFAKLLAQAAGEAEPGLSWFGGFRTQAGRLDIKKSGLFGIVTTARVLAIRHHVVERSTLARLAGLRALALGGESDLEGLADAQAVFLELILNQQIDDIEHGRPATNAVQVRSLKSRDYKRLRLALATVINLAELTQDLLFED